MAFGLMVTSTPPMLMVFVWPTFPTLPKSFNPLITTSTINRQIFILCLLRWFEIQTFPKPFTCKSQAKGTLPPHPSLTLNSSSSTNVYGSLSYQLPWPSPFSLMLVSPNMSLVVFPCIPPISCLSKPFIMLPSKSSSSSPFALELTLDIKFFNNLFSYHAIGVALSHSFKSLLLVSIWTRSVAW